MSSSGVDAQSVFVAASNQEEWIMAVDAIGSVVGAGVDSATATSTVGQDEFLRLFLTQLSFQDPLEPVDNREFLAQLAQFASVEQLRALNENIEGNLQVAASQQAVELLGRTVDISTSANGDFVTGQVTTVNFRQGSPALTVQTSSGPLDGIALAQVLLVRGAASAAP
jgi:flagellar basal-body rod modification protein FlgD